MDTDCSRDEPSDGLSDEVRPRPKVRPIQMGEFLRKLLIRRTLHVNREEVQQTMLSHRQWGVGAPGDSEAIAHCHLGLESLHRAGQLPRPMLVVQIDAENFFGSLEWDSIREALECEPPELAPATAWKHQSPRFAQQDGVAPQQKNRGAEQGDAAAAAETGATLGIIARSTWWDLHEEQASGRLPDCSPHVGSAHEHHGAFLDEYGRARQLIDG